MFEPGQSNFLQALGWAVLNSLWQLALLWVIYQLITALFAIKRPSQKSYLATLLLFSGSAWFVFTFFAILAENHAARGGYSALLPVESNAGVTNLLLRILPVASVIYLALLVLPIWNFIRNYRYVGFIRRHGLKKADVRWRLFTQKVAAQMGIVKNVQVWMSEFVNSPVTIGYLKPIVLLPVAAVNNLSTQQIEAVLLHELSHIRRSDYLVNLVTRIIQTILYFNPFVKAFSSIIEKEREKHCDEIVLQFQYEPHGYASALLEIEKSARRAHLLAVAASGNRKNELLVRIETIMGIRKKPVLSLSKLAGVLAALLCFISLNAILVMSRPGDSKTSPGLLTNLSDPFHLLSPSADDATASMAEVRGTEIFNRPTPLPVPKAGSAVQAPPSRPAIDEAVEELAKEMEQSGGSPFMFVNLAENVIPQLDPEKEEQVKEALVASRKVLTEAQWKNVENGIADALTGIEKEKVKLEYQKAMNKLDWQKIENKMKVAYNDINWEQVNKELKNALVEIKLDSLQTVYTAAVNELNCLEKELTKAEVPVVPDTDITLESVESKKKEVIKAINTIRAVKAKKIIHL